MARQLTVLLVYCLMSVAMCTNCPDYWTAFNGKCYKFFPDNLAKPWSEARTWCRDRFTKGDLVSITSIKENTFVASLTSDCSSTAAQGPKTWLGMGPDFHQQNPKFWVDGSPFSDWELPWEQGEPNNKGGNQNCIATNHKERGLWDDEDCSEVYPFVCEINPSD